MNQLSLFKGPRQRGTRPPPALEFAMHCSIADALRVGLAPGWLWTHFPAGEARDEKTGARLKRMGLQKGWSDLLLISPTGLHHWLELKRGKAPLTDEQGLFLEALEARGVPCAVARSFDQAIAQLTAWGALRLTVSA